MSTYVMIIFSYYYPELVAFSNKNVSYVHKEKVKFVSPASDMVLLMAWEHPDLLQACWQLYQYDPEAMLGAYTCIFAKIIFWNQEWKSK